MYKSSIIISLLFFGCEQFKPHQDDDVDPITDPDDPQDTDDTDDSEDPNDLDDDGDGYSINDGDCDDSDSSLNQDDSDNDGQSTCDGDCNDDDSSVFDGAEEICDGQFNDCAGDMTQPEGSPNGEDDNDEDGFFACADDCDDNNAFIYPGAAFMDSTTECMLDADGDGYGADLSNGCCYTFELGDTYGDGWNGGTNLEVFANGQSVGTASVSIDAEANEVETTEICIESDASIEFVFNSGTYADEIFGSIYDIDGTTIGSFTGTGGYAGMQTLDFSDGNSYEDGQTLYTADAECQINENTQSGTDCDDSDSQTNPGAIEIWYNNVDNDCAGDLESDFDQDGDGQDSDDYEGGTDCNDYAASAYLGANEVPNDGIDNNCNGQIDEGFFIQTIASGVSYSGGRPLAIDVDNYGFAHIIYEESGSIEYVTNSSGIWTSSTTAPTDVQTDAGYHLRAKVDGLDRLQVAYTSEFNGTTDIQFMYLDTITSSWSIEWLVDTITTSTLTSEFQLDIDVDGNNLPALSWYNQDDETPWMVDISSNLSNSTTSLTGEFVQLDDNCLLGFCIGYTGTYSSIAIDNSDTNHVIFYNSVQGQENQYNYVFDNDTSAECNDQFQSSSSAFVEQDGNGVFNDIAIMPSSNRAGVAYQDGVDLHLMYAHNPNGGCGGWNYELVDSANAGYYSSLEYTSNDEPYIAYYAATTGDLRIAFHDGTTWLVEDIDTYGNVGQFLDMTIDSNNTVHIVYYDSSSGSIKYAYGQVS